VSQPPTDSLSSSTGTHWIERLPKIAGVFALVLVFSYVWKFQAFSVADKPDAWGQFGDYMGGLLNPFISLFTLIVALHVWKLQKIELKETRDAVIEQSKTAEQQRREQRFFDLLRIYQETLKSFIVENTVGKAALNNWTTLSRNTRSCSNFLKYGFGEFDYYLDFPPPSDTDESFRRLTNPKTKTLSVDQINAAWDGFSPLLDHYFRTIFAILGELEELLTNDHWRYAKLFRAQLSRDELTLLAFNLLFDDEGKKMRSLVEKYGLLKHLADTKLRDYAIAELNPEAFGFGWVNAQKVSA
jgi:hypothetical protein